MPFDLSEVLFIATANFIQNIPAPLLDRMEVVEFAGYTEREKAEIAKKYLIPRQLEEAGLGDKNVRFTDDSVTAVISKYTREAGVRQLERQVGAVARKVARRIAAGDPKVIEDGEINADEVRDLLGRPKVHPEHAAEENEIGVATGIVMEFLTGETLAGRLVRGPLPLPEALTVARQVAGQPVERVDLAELQVPLPMPEEQLLALDAALDRLSDFNARSAQVVKLIFFVGLTQEQTAEELGVSLSTVERLWSFARTWLFREMQKDGGAAPFSDGFRQPASH